MTRDELVNEMLLVVDRNLAQTLGCLAMEERYRLAGLEAFIRYVMAKLLEGIWQKIESFLEREAWAKARICTCGRQCETQSRLVRVKVLGLTLTLRCTYFYCRHCHRGESPVRKWLGVNDGGTSLQLERCLTDLTERMTFGDAINSMQEQHRQEIDRTQAERITYRVGAQASEYLDEKRKQAVAKLGQEGRIEGVEQLQLTADGGAIPIGQLVRPKEKDCTKETPRTPGRDLPKGTRSITGREARLISVREPSKITERMVDCHIAPYDQTEFTGERMFAAAAMAGLGDNTKMHGVFDMGKWIHTQYEAQFHGHERTACADIVHVTEYLTAAGREIEGDEKAKAFGMENKHRMLDGENNLVLKTLEKHRCNSRCIRDEQGNCVVHAALRYLKNHREYLNYPPIIALGLPVGSGEAESGIRHLIKKRLDVAGAWVEGNAQHMLALIAVRASGLWDDFWQWRNRRDIDAWHKRQNGQLRSRFRGRLPDKKQPETAAA